jgi:hypothetical protein
LKDIAARRLPVPGIYGDRGAGGLSRRTARELVGILYSRSKENFRSECKLLIIKKYGFLAWKLLIGTHFPFLSEYS